MKLKGTFDFVSHNERSFNNNKYDYVTLLDSAGQCWTFKVNDFVEPFMLGDKVEAEFEIFKNKEGGYFVSLVSLDAVL